MRTQCEQGARLGYTGKQVIHPGQIEIVQNVFVPNSKQIEWAKGLLEAFNSYQESGKVFNAFKNLHLLNSKLCFQGAFNYRGSMIDMPTMKQAQNIMTLADKIKGSDATIS